MLDIEVFKQVVMDSQDGITITDMRSEDYPLIFVNQAFERMTGYLFEDIEGKNCRFLQGDDTEQAGLDVIRDSVTKGGQCLVTIRNYRKDGSMFWNELSLSAVYNEQKELCYYIGIQKDVTSKVLYVEQLADKSIQLKSMQGRLGALVNVDPITAVYSREYFDKQLITLSRLAERAHSLLTILSIELDFYDHFVEAHGEIIAGECLKSIASTLSAAFRRAADFIARYDDKRFVIATYNMNDKDAKLYAEELRKKIFNMNITFDLSNGYDRLTVSIGYASMAPVLGLNPDEIVLRANAALTVAKNYGGNRVQLFGRSM